MTQQEERIMEKIKKLIEEIDEDLKNLDNFKHNETYDDMMILGLSTKEKDDIDEEIVS